MIIKCYSNNKEKIFLRFYPCKNLGENISFDYVYKQSCLTVYENDYNKLLLPFLNEIFPLIDPTDNEIQQTFDVCADNWIDKSSFYKIIDKIKDKLGKLTLKNEIEFYVKFIEWFEKKSKSFDLVMIEGNL